MTPADREKAIRFVMENLPVLEDTDADHVWSCCEKIVDGLAALSPTEPVQDLPALDPDEQAKHEQAMRELAALAFDPNSLDRSQVDRSQDSASPWSRAIGRPELIGLCSEHGWWFPAQATHQGWCPEHGCHATVYIYERFAEFQPVATAQ